MTQSVPTVFNFQSHPVRTVLQGGEPWFVASDVADALGYATAKDAARNLADNQKGRHILPTPGGTQSVTIINESGLYRLVLRSRKPEAVAFSDWVTGEVLPAIRKTGQYNALPVLPAPQPHVVSLPGKGRYLVDVLEAGHLTNVQVYNVNHCAVVDADHVRGVQRDLRTLGETCLDVVQRLSVLLGEASPERIKQPLTVTLTDKGDE